MITQRCNYSCSYCASYDNTQPFSFKTLDDYIKAFEYLSKRYGNKTIKLNFLGGEPTLFKQWVELVNWLSEHNYVPEITTNLSVPAETYVDKLNGNAYNFITASYHPEFTTKDKFKNNAKILSDKGYLKAITLLADPNNWQTVMSIYKEFSEVGKVHLVKIKNEHTSNPAISSSFVDYSEEQLKVFDTSTEDPYMTVELEDRTIHPSVSTIRSKYSNFRGLKCAVGKDRLHIKPNGDVFPSACLLNMYRSRMGNIYEQNVIVPKNPITCPFNECLCGPDIRIEKWA